MNKNQSREYDYIIAGTGPGGAPVALELARNGNKVLLLEKGAWHRRLLGFPFGMRLSERFFAFNRSREGVVMERGITVGGSSMIYQGNVFNPSEKLVRRMGIDFRQEAAEIKNEIGTRTLPPRFYNRHGYHGLERLIKAAEEAGTPFEEQEKFVDPDICREGCDWCMLGCPRDAKWTTRRIIEEGLARYPENFFLETSSPVEELLFNENRSRVEGVKIKGGSQIRSGAVILAAGGIGTPAILQRSGYSQVGKRFFMDPMTILYGLSSDPRGGQWGEQTFSHAIESYADSDGFMIGNNAALGTWLVMSLIRPRVAMENWHKLPFVRRGMGLFVKLAEDDRGEIFPNERTSKPVTESDIKRMDRGVGVARDIMLRAGAKESSLSMLQWAGGHPGGTVAMGSMADKNFRFECDNLYVCDASLFPESPGSPPSLSIMAMSRLLGKILNRELKAEERYL